MKLSQMALDLLNFEMIGAPYETNAVGRNGEYTFTRLQFEIEGHLFRVAYHDGERVSLWIKRKNTAEIEIDIRNPNAPGYLAAFDSVILSFNSLDSALQYIASNAGHNTSSLFRRMIEKIQAIWAQESESKDEVITNGIGQ